MSLQRKYELINTARLEVLRPGCGNSSQFMAFLKAYGIRCSVTWLLWRSKGLKPLRIRFSNYPGETPTCQMGGGPLKCGDKDLSSLQSYLKAISSPAEERVMQLDWVCPRCTEEWTGGVGAGKQLTVSLSQVINRTECLKRLERAWKT